MTATCTLCGIVLNSPEDQILEPGRDDRTFSRLGALYRKHFSDCHAKDSQTFIADQLPAGVSMEQAFGVLSVTTQACVMFSYLKSEDEVFLEKSRLMREIVQKAIEQKEMKPSVVLG